MAYSYEFRSSVIEFIKKHPEKSLRSVSRQFDLAPKTVISWKKNGIDNKLSTRRNHVKVDRVSLKEYVERYPDSYLSEIGEHFNVCKSTIGYNLKKMGYSRKKKIFVTQSKIKTKY